MRKGSVSPDRGFRVVSGDFIGIADLQKPSVILPHIRRMSLAARFTWIKDMFTTEVTEIAEESQFF